MHHEICADGTELFAQGDEGTTFYIIFRGSCKLYAIDEGLVRSRKDDARLERALANELENALSGESALHRVHGGSSKRRDELKAAASAALLYSSPAVTRDERRKLSRGAPIGVLSPWSSYSHATARVMSQQNPRTSPSCVDACESARAP